MADERKIEILRRVYQKLDGLPLGFGISAYNENIEDDQIIKLFNVDYIDTMREIRCSSLDEIEENAYDEMQLENRVVYHALRRYRLSSAVYFKFSTAVDGKTIDKTNIPKMLNAIILEYENDFKSWRSGNVAQTWNMSK